MPHFDREDVKAAMTGRYADFYMQFTPLKPLGGELRGACPLHGGTGANFAVNPDTGLWNCFSGCQDGGDAFHFIEKMEGVSFPEALERVAAFAGVSGGNYAPSSIGSAARRSPPSGQPVPAEVKFLDIGVAEQLHENLMNSDKVRRWLSDARGLTTETLIRFGIGLLPPAVKGEEWRICFPVLDKEGRLTNIRKHLFAYKPDLTEERRRELGKTKPWEPGLSAGLFPLSALEAGVDILIVEGEADAALACQIGFSAVTGTGGAGTWKPEWTEFLRSFSPVRVTLLYDGDKPGQDGARKAAAALAAVLPDVRIASIPDGEDFTIWVVEKGATRAAVQQAIDDAVPFALTAASQTSPEPARRPKHSSPAWEPPTQFTSHSLPPFPLEALPAALGAYVGEIAASSQVPVDMAAMLGLSVVGAAAGRRCMVQIGRTHSEPTNLFCAVVMEPGSRKSAIMDMTAPLREYEAAMVQQETPRIAAAKEVRAVEEKRATFLREAAAKEKTPEKRGETLAELQDMAASFTEIPALPRLLADDVTTEKCASLMAENGGALALLSAEGGIFSILAGRYSGKGEANLDVFLKGHAGDEIRVDRQNRPPDFIRRPSLTVGLLVQPDVLASLADSPSFRGRGLLGRFLYSLPESLAGSRKYQDRPVDAACRARYAHAITEMLLLPSAGTEEDPSARHSLALTGEALSLWAVFADDVEARQAEGGDLAGVRDWASKLAGQVARIAAGFHLFERAGGDWQSPISAEAVAAAWAVGQYLIPHALAAFGQMSADPHLALCRRILRWMQRSLAPGDGETTFTLRECQRAHTGGGQALKAEDAQAALLLLAEHEFIRPVPARQETGGRPGSAAYAVNPAVFSKGAGS